MVFVGLGTANFAYAGEFQAGENLIINLPVGQDLYAAGANIQINKPVDGDVIIAGGVLTIDEKVAQDLVAAGGQISVRATVGDDVRIAGGDITIDSEVMGDVVVTGGNITVTKNAHIHGDLMISGGHISIAGIVSKDAHIAGGEVLITADIKGKTFIETDQVSLYSSLKDVELRTETLDIASNVTIENAKYDLMIQNPAFLSHVKGEASQLPKQPVKLDKDVFKKTSVFFFILCFLSTLLLALIYNKFLADFFKLSSESILKTPLKSFLFGLVGTIVIWVLLVLLACTLIGLPLAIISSLVFGFVLIFQNAVISCLVLPIIRGSKYKLQSLPDGIILALILLLLGILGLVPFVNWVVTILFCIAFGSVYLTILQAKHTL